MMKKVKIEIISGMNPIEGLPRFLEKFPQYRRYNVQNHILNASLPSNHICIYCNFGEYRYYGKRIMFPSSLDFSNRGSFTDWYGGRGALEYKKGSKNILFLSKSGYIIGLYIDEKRTLVLMDITHYDDSDSLTLANQILEWILNTLKKEGISDTVFLRKSKSRYALKSIGADPEFELFKGGNVISADEVYDSTTKSVGCDGSGNQLELRPSAGKVTNVVKSLRHLLLQVREDGFDVGLTNHYPCGGHIHFGYGQAVTPGKGFLEALDDFLGIPTRRLIYRSGYGELSDYEVKPWGFEYRTPSAVIFSNKKIANISLKIAYLIGSKVGRTLTYNNPPTKEDYIKLGLTERQADYFLNFIESFSGSISSIYGGWKIEPVIKGVIPTFRDEWDEEVKKKIKEALKKVRTKNPVYITLFGLREDRGKVNTIPIRGYRVIEHPYKTLNTIGVAREIRFGKNISVFIKDLKKYIKEILNR